MTATVLLGGLVACASHGTNPLDAAGPGDGVVPSEAGPPDAMGNEDVGQQTPVSREDLQGAWYALEVGTDAGVGGTHTRLRFDGDRYYLVQNTQNSYCAEVGTFALADSTLTFTIDYTQGFGPCVEGTERIETIGRTASGISLSYRSTVELYARARTVPKVFVTVETHDGNLAGDPLLPGASPIEKADNLCNRSVAKPDAQNYKALLVDGANRMAIPQRNWVLRPLTTYFRADGTLNVFTTNSSATVNPDGHHSLLDSAQVGPSAWTGLGFDLAGQNTCQGWSTASATVNGGVAYTNAAQFTFAFGGGASCQSRDIAFECVSDGATNDGGGADGGTGTDGAGPLNDTEMMLQGSWTGMPDGTPTGSSGPFDGAAGPRRLRFVAKGYTLVGAGAGSYCGEVGVVDATATSLRFHPQRIEGFGGCVLDVDRDESAVFDGAGFTLSLDNNSVRYVRAADLARIFATFETHNGDFAGDLDLAGGDAIAKADTFCNQSTARPDERTYKAILVGGSRRSASPSIDWALKPSTPYFQAIAATNLFTTNTVGLYDQTVAAIPILPGFGDGYAWTGLKSDGTTSSTCAGWSSHARSELGQLANLGQSSLTSGVVADCTSLSHGLLCAGQ